MRGSIIVTTNRGVARFAGRIFDDPTIAAAMLDRLLHRSVVFNITGDRYRMRRHRDAIAPLRPALTGHPQGAEFPSPQPGNSRHP